MKKAFKKGLILILRLIFVPFYDAKYLRGRYFDESFTGWIWAAQGVFFQRILRRNPSARYPVSPSTCIDDPSNLIFDPNDLQNLMHTGCYFSNAHGGTIIIGSGTVIAPNVGIVTTHHKLTDVTQHQEPKDVIIGRNCWLGMGSVILPGVTLGDGVVVAANAVVTQSFPIGSQLLAGAPATVKKSIE